MRNRPSVSVSFSYCLRPPDALPSAQSPPPPSLSDFNPSILPPFSALFDASSTLTLHGPVLHRQPPRIERIYPLSRNLPSHRHPDHHRSPSRSPPVVSLTCHLPALVNTRQRESSAPSLCPRSARRPSRSRGPFHLSFRAQTVSALGFN